MQNHLAFSLTLWFFVGLVHLQFGQQTNKPFERLLVSVDPYEVHLGRTEHSLAVRGEPGAH